MVDISHWWLMVGHWSLVVGGDGGGLGGGWGLFGFAIATICCCFANYDMNVQQAKNISFGFHQPR